MSTIRSSTLLTLTLLLATLFSTISASPLASPVQPRNGSPKPGVNLASYTVPTSDGGKQAYCIPMPTTLPLTHTFHSEYYPTSPNRHPKSHNPRPRHPKLHLRRRHNRDPLPRPRRHRRPRRPLRRNMSPKSHPSRPRRSPH